MGVNKYFFDSYALIELIKGNPRYIPYIDAEVVITVFNLVEVCYSVYVDYGKEKALQVYDQFKEYVCDVDSEIVLDAITLRKGQKRRDLSYTDCIGYSFAKRHDLLFLTGDEQFRTFEKVEFVKA